MAVTDPTFEVEQAILADGARWVIGCDEVGRGALAGPVAVGMAVVDSTVGPVPDGLRDSKLLSEQRREALAPLATAWVARSAVGLATAAEVDEIGIIAALGCAGRRALTALHYAGIDIPASVVLLDGRDDWLNKALEHPVNVVTRVKADRDCGSVAAASVIAKVHRDRLMIEEDARNPRYGWSANKGYGSAGHLSAIVEFGPSGLHRKSWLKISA